MSDIKKRLLKLSDACFDIEKDLPMFGADCNNNEQYLRKELYNIRIKLQAQIRYAELADDKMNEIDMPEAIRYFEDKLVGIPENDKRGDKARKQIEILKAADITYKAARSHI